MDCGLECLNNAQNTMQAGWGRLHGFRKLISRERNDVKSV